MPVAYWKWPSEWRTGIFKLTHPNGLLIPSLTPHPHLPKPALPQLLLLSCRNAIFLDDQAKTCGISLDTLLLTPLIQSVGRSYLLLFKITPSMGPHLPSLPPPSWSTFMDAVTHSSVAEVSFCPGDFFTQKWSS